MDPSVAPQQPLVVQEPLEEHVQEPLEEHASDAHLAVDLEAEHKIKKREPTQAMAALASVMNAGRLRSEHPNDAPLEPQSLPLVEPAPAVKPPKPTPSPRPPLADSGKPTPAPRASKPTPAPNATSDESMRSSQESTDPVTFSAKPMPPKRAVKSIPVDTHEPVVEAPVPRPRAVPLARPKSEAHPSPERPDLSETSRPASVAVDDLPDPHAHSIPEAAAIPAPAPRRIPGVFSTQHGAIGALAAAVTGRKSTPTNSPVDGAFPTMRSDSAGSDVGKEAGTAPVNDHTSETEAPVQHVCRFLKTHC